MNNSKTTKFFDQVKLTRSSRLMEDENHFFEGLFGTVTLLSTALVWLLIASILISVNVMVPGWVCIGIGVLCILVWAVIHVVPPFWKWLGKTWFVKWIVSLVEI